MNTKPYRKREPKYGMKPLPDLSLAEVFYIKPENKISGNNSVRVKGTPSLPGTNRKRQSRKRNRTK